MAKSEIKVFRLDECTWYAGETADGCYEQYSKDTGMTLMELREDAEEYPQVLGVNGLARFMYHDDDERTKRTFAAQLLKMIEEGAQFPCIFATTEF